MCSFLIPYSETLELLWNCSWSCSNCQTHSQTPRHFLQTFCTFLKQSWPIYGFPKAIQHIRPPQQSSFCNSPDLDCTAANAFLGEFESELCNCLALGFVWLKNNLLWCQFGKKCWRAKCLHGWKHCFANAVAEYCAWRSFELEPSAPVLCSMLCVEACRVLMACRLPLAI